MANNFQNVTLSLTLPISCQICLGKVRQPVICANNHVFCSCCMDIWLKKASQCPSCRVPITSENPCREIIGGTNESESHSVKKRLRKTRGELLLREYEDEMEGLLKENEELRNKNQSMESRLKTALDPCTITAGQRENKGVDPGVLEEWSNKLRAATDGYSQIKLDVEKLKEANKMLRSQNIDLVQENMRLKAEVASRSPQKFGRYTVAALEAKIHQYERDVDHLKRALERSDLYIEELEARGGRGAEPPGPHRCPSREHLLWGGGGRDQGPLPEDQCHEAEPSDVEKASICASLEGESKTLSAHQSYLLAASNAVELNGAGSETFRDHRRGFGVGVTLAGHNDSIETDSIGAIAPSDLLLPSTPSSAFRSLSLKGPSVGEDKKLGCKSVTYLRRLSFEDGVEPSSSGASSVGTKRSRLTAQFSNGVSSSNVAEPGGSTTTTTKPAFWAAAWHSHKASDVTSVTSVTSPNHIGEQQLNTSWGSGHSERDPTVGATTSQNRTDEETDPMSSEASMDAAYLDKISELDSMMLEGPESCSSRSSAGSHLSSGSHLSLASSLSSADSPDLTLDLRLDATLVPELEGCSESFLGPDSDQDREGGGQTEAEGRGSSSLNQRGRSEGLDLACSIKGTSSATVRVSETQAAAPASTSTTTGAAQSGLTSGTGSVSSSGRDVSSSSNHHLLGSTGPAGGQTGRSHLSDPSQTDELSFDLLFDPSTETKTGPGGPSGWQASADHHDEDSDISSGCSAVGSGEITVRQKSTVAPSQAAKRKSHSPFNIGSPSKHSKLM
ncbi:LOW QUALITY PROTEIN: ORC ubiquitin ligase 1 [Coregonus clupeaformis]|uniref:LOW QUALITY PROTEIN: ORC ubiquitin ligase 1 n=1 Tax=Coregonus clupeaformis TaxID=59861 RepID=UPI001E1C659D|nr:LOW QUALITY PROTEIN: ORC ubiquitin ligase 1 [Coregonus clupeaformis]